MSDLESHFHAEWLGLVQPVEGLLVSVPVLADAQCMRRQPLSAQQHLADLAPAVDDTHPRRIADVTTFLADVLSWTPDLYDTGPALPDDLSLYVPEGGQTLRPTLALRRDASSSADTPTPADATPASLAGAAYVCLLWDLPPGLALDRPETTTGPWDYPPVAKFDRLLRACRVPVGLLTNREVVRLVYAPHGESSGSITFRVDDMASVAGRPIFDAFVMLLSAERFLAVAPEHQLPSLLKDSRTRQANVTNELADQLLDALGVLLAGFVAASERDGHALLDDAQRRTDDHLYKGLLTVLLRLVFLLYAEDRGLMPMEDPVYSEHLSVLGLFDKLQRDHGEHPDSMARRFGAWPRLLALFRAVFLGLEYDTLVMPARRGELFDPHRFAFLEGWGPAGTAPIDDDIALGKIPVPTVDDGTIFTVLERLLMFQGQRLSYRVLDVEQIGAVYEALMGYHVVQLGGPSVCLKGDKGVRVWIQANEVLEQPSAQRGAWVAETAGIAKAQGPKISAALKDASDTAAVITALTPWRVKSVPTASPGQRVIQPGQERRRTSSHYTPPSLTGPIVRRTLEPLLAAMGEAPASEKLLELKVCDPAMGSGAFLVEACRFLGDQVVAAWTREGRLDVVASTHGDVVLHARRLVAQRCLYGVDKNPLAVSLAKLSLWLVTLAKDEPFTFVDHALRHGDSLVGLDMAQLKSFHWKPGPQLEIGEEVLATVLDEAVAARQRILALAGEHNGTRLKEHLLWDANDALMPARLVADLVVGAFFAKDKDKARETERLRRLELVTAWLKSREPPPEELLAMQAKLRETVPAFHWPLEFPEVFWDGRKDPLEGEKVTGAAWLDAFVGNPPFTSRETTSATFGFEYVSWLIETRKVHGVVDLSVHFLRRANDLLGESGTTGFITTSAVAEGEHRKAGLAYLLSSGNIIYWSRRKMAWPGEAAVHVAIIHLAKGSVLANLPTLRFLDGEAVERIGSQLLAGPESKSRNQLSANESLASKGLQTGGEGFIITPAERDELIASDEKNSERIFEYIGGREITTSPIQAFDRYVINFGQVSLMEAAKWPQLLKIVEERVRPEREKMRDHAPGMKMKKYWWQFYSELPKSRTETRSMNSCLVTSHVSKHLAFCLQPTRRIVSKTAYVIALDRMTAFSVLQSRLHEFWSRSGSASRGDGIQYNATESFATFPFPQQDPRTVIPALETIGERLYTTRAKYMVDTNQGLTQTYNQLKDPRCREPRVVELRRLHEEMDRAVLVAYGWSDLEVPPYGTPVTDAEKKAVERFEDAVIDRLFELNALRAKDEAQVLPAKPKSRGKRGTKGDSLEQGGLFGAAKDKPE